MASDGPVPLRLDGPASFDEPEVAPVKESVGDDEGDNEPETHSSTSASEQQCAAPVEGDVAELGLFCMASDVTNADLDVERALKEFSAKLEMLYDTRPRMRSMLRK